MRTQQLTLVGHTLSRNGRYLHFPWRQMSFSSRQSASFSLLGVLHGPRAYPIISPFLAEHDYHPTHLDLRLPVREIRKLLTVAFRLLKWMRQPTLAREDIFRELARRGELCAVVNVDGCGAYVGGFEEVEDVWKAGVGALSM